MYMYICLLLQRTFGLALHCIIKTDTSNSNSTRYEIPNLILLKCLMLLQPLFASYDYTSIFFLALEKHEVKKPKRGFNR